MDWTERELLEQTEWMQRIARALTRDVHQADDLVQEAWIASLGERSRVHSPKAWFRRVLHNRKISAQRREGRRRDHEQSAARPDRAASVDEAVERVELQEKLARIVFDLEAPYRQVIALRYLQGWPPRRIATELHLHPRKVEVQLRQGLQKLRTQLDAECNGGRDEWFGAMLAIGSSTTPLLKKAATVCAGALLLGAIPMMTMWLPETPRDTQDVVALPTPELAQPLATGRPSGSPLSRRSSMANPRRAVHGHITFRRWDDHLPLADLSVRVDGEEFRTDENGRLAVTWPPMPESLELRIAATRSTRAAYSPMMAGRERERTVFLSRRGGTLRGRVETMEGDPVPLAEVRLFDRSGSGSGVRWEEPLHVVQADGQGVFEIHDLAGPTGGRENYEVLAHAPGQLSTYVLEGSLRRHDVEEALLLTEPAVLVRGRVTAHDRAFVANAPMKAYSKNGKAFKRAQKLFRERSKGKPRLWGKPKKYPAFEFQSGEDGTFEFLRPQSTAHLQVDHPDYRQWRDWVHSEEHLEVRLEDGTALRGRILDEHGHPLAEAEVSLAARERRPTVLTGVEGEFVFKSLTPMSGALISVTCPGHACGVFTVDIDLGSPHRDFQIERERIVRGRLVDEEGRGLAGERVELRGDRVVNSPWFPRHRGITWERYADAGSWQAMTNDAGEFEFRGLYPGLFRVVAGEDTWARVPPDEDAPFEVCKGTAEGSVSLRGVILSPSGPENYTVIATRFIEGESEATRESTTRPFDSSGFEIHALDPGSWRLNVHRAGSAKSWTVGPLQLDAG
ncbi:MAG: sigma-70 family RNA polymerase sigma factor, partial [Planctomycetota bacterium]